MSRLQRHEVEKCISDIQPIYDGLWELAQSVTACIAYKGQCSIEYHQAYGVEFDALWFLAASALGRTALGHQLGCHAERFVVQARRGALS